MRDRLSRHAQVLLSCLGRMHETPVSTLLTLSGIGVALSVPLILYVLVSNMASVFADWNETPRLSIYLDPGQPADFVNQLAALISGDESVERADVIDRERALAELLEQNSLAGLADQLAGNPLPDVIEVHPRAAMQRSEYRDLGERFALMDGVADIQFDLEWVERLRAVTDLALAALRVFWVLLFAAVAMVISNSVRLGMVTARREIEVISLVGGSEPFIRRPYLYQGLLNGVLGAAMAILIAWVVYLMLSPALSRLLDAYLGIASVDFAPASVLMMVMLGAGLTGWLAALLTAHKFLREILPR